MTLLPEGCRVLLLLYIGQPGLNVQYTYFAINGGLLIASLVVLGWKFSVKTIFAVLVMTFILPIIQSATIRFALTW